MAVPVDVIPRRPTLLLIVVLSLLFILMSLSSQTRLGETRTLFERSVMTIFAPVPKTVNWVGSTAADMYHGYLDMRRSVKENLDLHRKVDQLTTENLRLRQSEGDLRRLRSLLSYTEQFTMPTIMAEAIMLDISSRFKSIVIDRGSNAGVDVDDAIVNANGLIGRVVLTTKDMSKVQLITDSNASVGVLIERTRRQGVLRGDGGGGAQLYDIPNQKIVFHQSQSPLRQGSYRGLAATANHFARECHLDELAHAVNIDPLEFRLRNLKDERLKAVFTDGTYGPVAELECMIHLTDSRREFIEEHYDFLDKIRKGVSGRAKAAHAARTP